MTGLLVTVRCPHCGREDKIAYYTQDAEKVRIRHECSALKAKVFTFEFDPPRRFA